MNKVSELLNDLGGYSAVASKAGVSEVTVNVWVHRKSIPRKVWPELMLANPRKATLKRLLETESN